MEMFLAILITAMKLVKASDMVGLGYISIYTNEKDFAATEKSSETYEISKIINLLSKSNCLALVDNYNGVDINHSGRPLILRRYVSGLLKTFPDNRIQYYLETSWESNFTLPLSNKFVPCPVSQHLAGVSFSKAVENLYDKSFCVQLDLSKFAAHTKSWTCEIHLLIQTQQRAIFKNTYGIFIISSEYEPRSMTGVFPSTRASFKVFIGNQITGSINNQGKLLKRGVKMGSVTGISFVTSFVRVFVARSVGLQIGIRKFTQLFELCHCLKCKAFVSPVPVAWNNVSIPSCNDETVYVFRTKEGNDLRNTLWTQIRNLLFSCHNVTHEQFKAKYTFSSSNNLIVNSYTTAWMSIFQNYSTNDNNINCVNGMFKPFTDKTDKFYPNYIRWVLKAYPISNVSFSSFSIAINDTYSGLRFVSCGRRGYDFLPFEHLINAYDGYNWSFILTVALVLSTLPSLFQVSLFLDGRSAARNLDCVYRILLGMDNPCSMKHLEKQSVRLTIAGLSLAAIVLTNAYKNDNVLRMVSSRQIAPVTNFEELVDGNYKIYTRAAFLDVVFNMRDFPAGVPKPRPWDRHDVVRITNSRSWILLESEVLQLSKQFAKNNEQIPTFFERIQNKSELPYSVLAALQNVSAFEEPEKSSGHFPAPGFFGGFPTRRGKSFQKDLFKNWFLLQEEKMTINRLKQCNKTAMLLPSHDAVDTAKHFVSRFGQIKQYFDVGLETYFPNYQTISLSGSRLPLKWLFRIQAAKESFILERWQQQFIELRRRFLDKAIRPTAASMSGNILVIFVVYLFGQLLSVIMYGFEHYQAIVQRLNRLSDLLITLLVMTYKAVSKFGKQAIEKTLVACRKLKIARNASQLKNKHNPKVVVINVQSLRG